MQYVLEMVFKEGRGAEAARDSTEMMLVTQGCSLQMVACPRFTDLKIRAHGNFRNVSRKGGGSGLQPQHSGRLKFVPV